MFPSNYLQDIVQKWRSVRFGNRSDVVPSLRLVYQLDDENVPPEGNIFNSSPAHELFEEISTKANEAVAKKLVTAMPDKAVLRRQSPPNLRRLQTFTDRMTGIGYEIDITSSGTLQSSLFKIDDDDIRKGV